MSPTDFASVPKEADAIVASLRGYRLPSLMQAHGPVELDGGTDIDQRIVGISLVKADAKILAKRSELEIGRWR